MAQYGEIDSATIQNVYPIRFRWKVEPWITVQTSDNKFYRLRYSEIVKALQYVDFDVQRPRKHYHLRVKGVKNGSTENKQTVR